MYREKFINLVCKRLKRIGNKIHSNDYFNKELFMLLVDNIYTTNILNIIVNEFKIIISIDQKIIIPNNTFKQQCEFHNLIILWDTFYGLMLYINEPTKINYECVRINLKIGLNNVYKFYSTKQNSLNVKHTIFSY